jgi:hypothetical protein
VPRAKILLAGGPPLLMDLISRMIARRSGLVLVPRSANTDAPLSRADCADADVLIVGTEEASANSAEEWLRRILPSQVVLLLHAGGRAAAMFRYAPQHTGRAWPEASIDALLGLIEEFAAARTLSTSADEEPADER